MIDSEGFAAFAAWHLAEDPDASQGTEGRYAFPYGELLRRLDEQRDG